MKRLLYGEDALDCIERNNLGIGNVFGNPRAGFVTGVHECHVCHGSVVTVWYDDVPMDVWNSDRPIDDILVVSRVEVEPMGVRCR